MGMDQSRGVGSSAGCRGLPAACCAPSWSRRAVPALGRRRPSRAPPSMWLGWPSECGGARPKSWRPWSSRRRFRIAWIVSSRLSWRHAATLAGREPRPKRSCRNCSCRRILVLSHRRWNRSRRPQEGSAPPRSGFAPLLSATSHRGSGSCWRSVGRTWFAHRGREAGHGRRRDPAPLAGLGRRGRISRAGAELPPAGAAAGLAADGLLPGGPRRGRTRRRSRSRAGSRPGLPG